MAEARRFKWLLPSICAIAVLIAIVLVVRFTQRLPSGPVPIVWDREACAECHMHVGEPRFAAQLQTKEGAVLNFDDPGCLLRYLATRQPSVHALYFHHLRKDLWLPRAVVGFVPAEGTPMGYNLGAVEAATSGGLSFEAAQAQVAARDSRSAE